MKNKEAQKENQFLKNRLHLDALLLSSAGDWLIYINGEIKRVSQIYAKTYTEGTVMIRLNNEPGETRVNTLHIIDYTTI